MTITTRFAPSPSGPLHLGHAFAALFAARAGDRFLLRFEDIDTTRCRREYEDGIRDDLLWLGQAFPELSWPEPVRRQSDHFADYADALDRLRARGLIYPCFCTRRDIAAEIAASPGAPQGPDGPLYPGLCRGMETSLAADRIARGDPHAWRLDGAAAAHQAEPLRWHDRETGWQTARPELFGDVVLARKDCPTSYHLAVTVDDHIQGITLVTRGNDLFAASHLHRTLQALLGLNVPEWHHHRLLLDQSGQRLAKRDGSRSLRQLRNRGMTPKDIESLILINQPY